MMPYMEAPGTKLRLFIGVCAEGNFANFALKPSEKYSGCPKRGLKEDQPARFGLVPGKASPEGEPHAS